jgi:hypothetical protein
MNIMKGKILIYVCLSVALCCSSSCEMKRDLTGHTTVPSLPGDVVPVDSVGLLDLTLKPHKEAELPKSTKADGVSGSDIVVLDVSEFSVKILDASGNLVKYFETYQEMKDAGELLLPAGDYSIVASLGDLVEAGFDMPFYEGQNNCKITPKEVAKIITDCVLANKKITLDYTEEFSKKFKDDYTIVFTNGIGILTTTKEEQRSAYFKNTGKLDFVIHSTTHDGKDLVYSVDLLANPEVGDHNNIHVNLDVVPDTIPNPDPKPDPDPNPDPDPSPDPDPTERPIIKVDISLIEHEEVIVIPSDFVKPGEDDGKDDNDKPSGDANKPVIKGLNGVVLDKEYAVNKSSKVAVSISTPNGLKSLKVKIKSSELEPLLPAVGIKNATLDMLNLSDMEAALFEGMTLPKANDTTCKFDVSGFMTILSGIPGTHTFTVSVEDKSGGKTSNSLILVVK